MDGPKRTKYRKMHGPRYTSMGVELKYKNPIFGVFILKAIENGIITSAEIAAARKTLKKLLKKRGKVWVGIFPDQSITSKPTEVRMGKGKGAHSYWVANVRAGRVIFEIGGVKSSVICDILRPVKQKIGLKTEISKLKE
jgi:large subunit ribosomal protein L16